MLQSSALLMIQLGGVVLRAARGGGHGGEPARGALCRAVGVDEEAVGHVLADLVQRLGDLLLHLPTLPTVLPRLSYSCVLMENCNNLARVWHEDVHINLVNFDFDIPLVMLPLLLQAA